MKSDEQKKWNLMNSFWFFIQMIYITLNTRSIVNLQKGLHDLSQHY